LKKIRQGEQFTIRMPSESEEGGFADMIYEIRELVDLVNQQQLVL
jgi:hypothetical protein